jgi:hypothetical protein
MLLSTTIRCWHCLNYHHMLALLPLSSDVGTASAIVR